MLQSASELIPGPVLQPRLADGKTEAIARILMARLEAPPRRLLVVGCGSGLEAAILSQELAAETIGIDIVGRFDPEALARVTLTRGDATRLDFPAASFDFVYSYHALEHILDYRRALREMRRVLRPGGSYCVGTPNRMRAIGYLGSKDASTREKIEWNLADWRARLQGRFHNEFGAHAGFSAEELGAALRRTFSGAEDITMAYYREVYRGRPRAVGFLHATGLGRVLFPSVYFTGPR